MRDKITSVVTNRIKPLKVQYLTNFTLNKSNRLMVYTQTGTVPQTDGEMTNMMSRRRSHQRS